MDAVTDPTVKTIVIMSSAQIGKTETLLNVIGFHVAHDPAPILMLQPTLEMGEAFSKDRLAPMLRDTPALKGKVKDPRSRDSGNQIRHKVFPGGHITIAGANSPASLASRPIRVVLADEVDRYPPSAGTEGDPLNLALRRTATFWNRKAVVTSTPTIKGLSRIEALYEASDRHRYWVPCPHCGDSQVLRWRQVQWPDGEPGQAEYVCEHCGVAWSDVERWAALRHGEWRAEGEFNGTVGFHLNEIASPWSRLGEMAAAFLEAKRHPETLKTWINTSLGETWEEDAERVDPASLLGRGEKWGQAPAGVLVLTGGVDVQDDRLEIERVGWGLGEESWSLDHHVIYGDPSGPQLWKALDEYLLTRTEIEDGRSLPVSCVAVDTGGHYTMAAYAFCRPRFSRRVYAIKGMAGAGRPVWPKRASKNNQGRVNLFLVGVDAAKDMILSRLKIAEPGPGYCHFPEDRDAEWFRQLTAERVVTKYVKGFPTRVYEKDQSTRNEALDCRAYAYAALQALNVSWGRVVASQQAARPVPKPDDELAEAPKLIIQQQPGVYQRRRSVGGRASIMTR